MTTVHFQPRNFPKSIGQKTAFYTFNLDATMTWFWFYDAQLKITPIFNLLIGTNDQ